MTKTPPSRQAKPADQAVAKQSPLSHVEASEVIAMNYKASCTIHEIRDQVQRFIDRTREAHEEMTQLRVAIAEQSPWIKDERLRLLFDLTTSAGLTELEQRFAQLAQVASEAATGTSDDLIDLAGPSGIIH